MGQVLLDLSPLILLIFTASIPLTATSLAVLTTVAFKYILPARSKHFLASLLSPPSDGGLAAEADKRQQEQHEGEQQSRRDDKVVVLAGLGVAETLAWTGGLVWTAVKVAKEGGGKQGGLALAAVAGVALSWAVSTGLLLPRRKVPSMQQAPAPMLHFSFYAMQSAFLVLHMIHLGLHRPHDINLDVSLTALHSIALVSLLFVTMSMPLKPTPLVTVSVAHLAPAADVAEAEVDDAKDEIYLESPERSVTLGSWIIFSWVGGLIEKGKKAKLGYRDVWQLPETMQSEGVQRSAAQLKYTRIIPRIFFNNSLDLILSLTLGLLSSFLSYLAPYFLKQILESLSTPSPSPSLSSPNSATTLRQSAFIYALLAFLSQIARAEVDLQQLWHERRALSRARTQLMGEVYEKALRRRDVSGVVLKKEEGGEGGTEGDKKRKGKGKAAKGQDGEGKDGKGKDGKDGKGKKKKEVPEARGTSSTGKIVSLMGGDANKVAQQLMTLSSIFGAPFELAIAITFLYQLLGWTCLAGLAVMAIAVPINNLILKRRVVIHRTMLSARDSRMEVLNELIQAVRFIKSSAAEEDWLKRVFDARETELGHLLRTRMNNLLVSVLWKFSPDLVMLVSFACFTLLSHKHLDVPTAFTALALFNMVRAPLTQLPMSFVSLLQTWVSIQRLEMFFGEEEVEGWVSSLTSREGGEERGLSDLEVSKGVGIEGGTLVYGEKEAENKRPDTGAIDTSAHATSPCIKDSNGDGTATPSSCLTAPEESIFELKDLSVEFPRGKLSLICGPTGSGKSSLFLALLGEMTLLKGQINLPKSPPSTSLDPETGLYEGVAYAAQLPWLQHMSIKENILFGTRFEKERYERVIEACALGTDFKGFEGGDETEIGERGISLSGGQKARVALARAVYSRARTVLLDDPLSAVDSHTARHLYEKCLCGPLLENRTVILITHHVSLCLGAAAYVIRMSDGRVALQGQVSDLDKAELSTELVEDDKVAADAEKEDAEEARSSAKEGVSPQDPKEADHAASAALAPPPSTSTSTSTPPTGDTTAVPTRAPSPSLAAPIKSSGKLVETESRATGRVKWKVYALYLSSAGYLTWAAMVLLIFLGRAGRVGDRSWFKVWGESYRPTDSLFFRMFMPSQGQQVMLTGIEASNVDMLNLPQFPSASDNVSFYLIGYLIICLLNLVITVFSILTAFQGSFRASRKLFGDTLRRVVYAPFRYFDTTPTGRILNRFSQDFNTIDGSLVDSFRITFTHLSSFVVNVLVVVIVSPSIVPAAALIIFAYVRYSLMFVKTSRDLRRLESNARSPIYAKFGETLQGIVTCRAFGAERRFLKGLYKSVDTMQAVAYSSAMANRYLLWRFDCLGATAVAITTLLSLTAGASPGYAALAITSAQSLVQSVYWASRLVSQLEVDLNAVERVVELLAIKQEPAQIITAKRPPATWPSSVGGISIENLVIQYAPTLDPVIKGISIEVPPRSKVGLVGRTGSGKSTLGMSLLRFVEPSQGKIVIDGIDVTQIGLNDLRRAVTLIPQEAVLFSGTVRSNLDPFNTFTDAECLSVLDRVGLINTSTSTALAYLAATPSPSRPVSPAPPVPAEAEAEAEAGDGRLVVPVQGAGYGGDMARGAEGAGSETESSTTVTTKVGPTPTATTSTGRMSVSLETPVSAGGNNYSAGQRQLLALARALLRNSRIIVMDESTASVDFETDEKIQHVMRESFADSLVLTIAHRLRSIIDYDLVLVLDAGEVIEFAKPSELLRDKEGVFRKMCEKASDWRELRVMAGLKEEE